MSSFERKVLVLDSRYEPVKVVSMQVGFVLLYTGRAEPLVESDRMMRTVSRSYSVPWIIRLQNSSPKGRRMQGPRFSRQNVYLRDGYRCQYCSWTGPLQGLTLDHLIPAAKGGKTTWENIVTACKACNLRKGMRAPEEVGLRLAAIPVRPHFHPASLFPLRYGLTRKTVPAVWMPYIDLSALDRLAGLLGGGQAAALEAHEESSAQNLPNDGRPDLSKHRSKKRGISHGGKPVVAAFRS
ncbi:MAG: HNH endonuclease [Silvanigrellales bacterium]|jgi:5-methylcytosine-specific restriction endonuclease McrA|nr:HNH endonuclease [Silvanigrellales bacterium]